MYLLDDLEEAKSAGDLYMRIDTHWNHRGAYVASLAICRELERLGVALAPVEKEWIEWLAVPFEGDLGGKLPRAQPGVNLQARLARSWSRRIYDNEVRNHGRVMVHEQDREQRPSCLVFGGHAVQGLGDDLLPVFKLHVVHGSNHHTDWRPAAERGVGKSGPRRS